MTGTTSFTPKTQQAPKREEQQIKRESSEIEDTSGGQAVLIKFMPGKPGQPEPKPREKAWCWTLWDELPDTFMPFDQARYEFILIPHALSSTRGSGSSRCFCQILCQLLLERVHQIFTNNGRKEFPPLSMMIQVRLGHSEEVVGSAPRVILNEWNQEAARIMLERPDAMLEVWFWQDLSALQ